ncbi:MAG: hypothetical protein ACMXYE_00705 [Candidatus Woesearchaeota archaeon]
MSLDSILGKKSFRERVTAFAENEKTVPSRITRQYLERMVREGRAIVAEEDYRSAAETIKDNPDRLIILPAYFDISFAQSNRMLKHPFGGEFIALTGKRTLAEAVTHAINKGYVREDTLPPERLTRALAEELHLSPENLLRSGIIAHSNFFKLPSIGYSWQKGERKRLTTWTRVVDAHRIADYGKHVRIGELIQKRDGTIHEKKPQFYGDTLRCWAPSVSSPQRALYSYQLRNLPITRNTAQGYSAWFDIEVNDPDPDGSYRGGGFNKVAGNIFWTRNAIAGFLRAGKYLHQNPMKGGRRMYVNPFPKITAQGTEFVDALYERCIITGERETGVPSMSSTDRIIGAHIANQGYDGFFRKQIEKK